MGEWLSSLRLRLRALVRRRQLERDLEDELTFHLAMREEQLRNGGASDAHTAAAPRGGRPPNMREELRDVWALAPSVAGLARDVRYAARTLRRNPVFAVVVIFTLGFGIGANTAFFSIVNAVLIRPLGYAAAGRLVALHEGFPKAGIDRLGFSALDYDDLRREQRSFESIAA